MDAEQQCGEVYGLPDSLRDFINDDDVLKFVPCMMEKFPCPQNGYGLLTEVEKDAQEPTYCPKHVVSFIFIKCAVNCATALLEGETGLTLNPNHPCSLGRYPLHDAASTMSYEMVDLLLHHGAQANVRTTELKPYTRGGLLPLSVAVENFRFHKYFLDWTPKQSIFKLIIIFCLPQMKAPLETCKLLAFCTMDVVDVFNGYCMDGKLFEVVALLMVAREKFIDDVNGRFLIHKHIVGEIEQLIHEEINLRRASKSVQACKDRMMNLKNTLLVLEVFERAGDAIGTYVEMVHHHTTKKDVVNSVERLLVERGFLLTQKDTNLSDIDCENGGIKLASQVLESKLRLPQQGISLLGRSQWGIVAGNVLYNKTKRWAMRVFFPHSSLPHVHDTSRRTLLVRRSTIFDGMPLLPGIRREYFSTVAKKGLRYL